MNKRTKSFMETKGIAQYLDYIKQRQAYLKIFVGKDYPLTEIKYYKELQQRIGEWAKKHRIAYQYIRCKINTQEAVELIGVSERVFYRLISKQKLELIDFIQKTEDELEKIYSFIPFTDDFISEVLDELEEK